MKDRLENWTRGSELKASHLQQPVDALNSLTPIVGDGGISVSQFKGAGTTIAFDGRAGFVERFQAIVMSQGPNGEADYTDARYWVQRAFIDTDTGIDGAIDFDVEGGTYYAADHTFTATNLAELRAGTHSLPTMTDHVVTVFSFQDRQKPPVKHFYMTECVTGAFPVTVEKDGGADGDDSNPATWTYTVRDLDGNILGEDLDQEKPRPNGSATYQAGSTGYGIAFYDGPDLKLWDAGEIYDGENPGGGATGTLSTMSKFYAVRGHASGGSSDAVAAVIDSGDWRGRSFDVQVLSYSKNPRGATLAASIQEALDYDNFWTGRGFFEADYLGANAALGADYQLGGVGTILVYQDKDDGHLKIDGTTIEDTDVIMRVDVRYHATAPTGTTGWTTLP